MAKRKSGPTKQVPPEADDVEVVAPSDDVFTAYARAVCEQRARVEDDPRLLEPGVAHGLATFLKLIAVLEARRINRERRKSVDSGAA